MMHTSTSYKTYKNMLEDVSLKILAYRDPKSNSTKCIAFIIIVVVVVKHFISNVIQL